MSCYIMSYHVRLPYGRNFGMAFETYTTIYHTNSLICTARYNVKTIEYTGYAPKYVNHYIQ